MPYCSEGCNLWSFLTHHCLTVGRMKWYLTLLSGPLLSKTKFPVSSMLPFYREACQVQKCNFTDSRQLPWNLVPHQGEETTKAQMEADSCKGKSLRRRAAAAPVTLRGDDLNRSSARDKEEERILITHHHLHHPQFAVNVCGAGWRGDSYCIKETGASCHKGSCHMVLQCISVTVLEWSFSLPNKYSNVFLLLI